jgi:hypothetical protein
MKTLLLLVSLLVAFIAQSCASNEGKQIEDNDCLQCERPSSIK